MKFCSECGHTVNKVVPSGDSRLRSVCPQCNAIHYVNPKIVAGTVPVWQGQVLLCRRAIEPRRGFWTLPAGFMELEETVHEAAVRETWEEAEARIQIGPLFTLVDIPYIGQVHMFYRGTIVNGEYGVGDETLESRLFAIADIPWKELAFRSVVLTLQHHISVPWQEPCSKDHPSCRAFSLQAPDGWGQAGA